MQIIFSCAQNKELRQCVLFFFFPWANPRSSVPHSLFNVSNKRIPLIHKGTLNPLSQTLTFTTAAKAKLPGNCCGVKKCNICLWDVVKRCRKCVCVCACGAFKRGKQKKCSTLLSTWQLDCLLKKKDLISKNEHKERRLFTHSLHMTVCVCWVQDCGALGAKKPSDCGWPCWE